MCINKVCVYPLWYNRQHCKLITHDYFESTKAAEKPSLILIPQSELFQQTHNKFAKIFASAYHSLSKGGFTKNINKPNLAGYNAYICFIYAR
jgi:hypothetical protein